MSHSAGGRLARGLRLVLLAVLLVGLFAALSLQGATALAPAAADATSGSTASAPDSSAVPDDAPGVERDGHEVVLAVPADSVDGNATATLTVAALGPADGAPAANNSGSTTVTATRRGDRYVASVPVADLVGPTVERDRSNATVRATHAGDVVLEAATDLRYLATTGEPTFDGATLVVPVDARGLGTTNASLDLADGRGASTDAGSGLAASIDGVGPGSSLRVAPDAVAALELRTTYRVAVRIDTGSRRAAAVPGTAFELEVVAAAAEASRVAYPDGEPVLVQPLLHPQLGPERVELRVATSSPDGLYVHSGTDERGVAPVSTVVAAAGARRVTVLGGGRTILDGVATGVERRSTVPLRIENGSLAAPAPGALAPYDAVVLRDDDGATYLSIGDRLRAGGTLPLPASVRPVDPDTSALLVGPDVRPARVDLSVVVPEDDDAVAPPSVPEPAPDADEFVGIWVDVGDGVVLLLLAMAGSAVPVGAAYGLRLLRPAASATADARAVLLHFALCGLAGVVAIATVQWLWIGPLLPTVRIAGADVGIGALLVGSVYGGIVGGALRVGLGTAGLWPTRYVAGGPTVPVTVTVTDDGGNAIPGEQTVEVRRPGTGRVLRTATVDGRTVDLELSPGEYGLVATTGERETDPRVVSVPTPDRTVPEAIEVDLAVARPGLQVEVADAETTESVATASVTVTTDVDKTKTATATDGTARLALPIETGTVTIVVDAEGYERTTVEQALDEQLRTVDVALAPVRGELVATAQIDGVPTGGVVVRVAPRGDDHPPIGVRTAALETDADGRASAELPVGEYVVRMQLEGANADLFEFATASVDVEADDVAEVAAPARFRWEPGDRLRRRDAELRDAIRAVAREATTDPTIPLYFSAVAAALLDVFEALPDAGDEFATAAARPDAVAAASIDAAQATLGAVGTATKQPAVQRVLAAADADPERVEPALDASPAALLAYLDRDVTVATVEARAERVRERIAADESSLATVAPVQAIVEVALRLPRNADASIQRAGREYAALRLLDAAEELFDRDQLRRRLATAPAEPEE